MGQVFEEYKEQLKLQLHADEKVQKVFSATARIKENVVAELSSANCCSDYFCFPFCLFSSLFLTPCGASHCFYDHGKALLKKEMGRTCCVLTTRGVYILQQALTNREATGIRFWGVFPQVYKELTFGGITFISWDKLAFQEFVPSGSCAKASKHVVTVWSSEKSEETFKIFCTSSSQAIEFFRSKQ